VYKGPRQPQFLLGYIEHGAQFVKIVTGFIQWDFSFFDLTKANNIMLLAVSVFPNFAFQNLRTVILVKIITIVFSIGQTPQ
jgi:hypothetical protein